MKFKASFRKANNDDLPLILSSWLRGSYTHCSAFRDMPKSLFFAIHHVACKKLISCAEVLCCVDAEDDNHVLGYIVFAKYKGFSVIHWVYVKQQFRGFKMGRELLRQANLEGELLTSHETYESSMWLNRSGFPAIHCPHLRHGDWHENSLSFFLSSRSDQRQNDQLSE